jgi:hypothetical protein
MYIYVFFFHADLSLYYHDYRNNTIRPIDDVRNNRASMVVDVKLQ